MLNETKIIQPTIVRKHKKDENQSTHFRKWKTILGAR